MRTALEWGRLEVFWQTTFTHEQGTNKFIPNSADTRKKAGNEQTHS
jgi:hypothetical protein